MAWGAPLKSRPTRLSWKKRSLIPPELASAAPMAAMSSISIFRSSTVMLSAIADRSSKVDCQSTPPRRDMSKISFMSCLTVRNGMLPNDSVLLVTTLSNCIQRLLVSSVVLIRKGTQ